MLKNQVLVDIEKREIDKDLDNNPLFEIIFLNPPKNYKLVEILEEQSKAILENLDYKENEK